MKIKYRLVFNRANRLNKMGQGLIQVEAYQNGRKAYFSTHVFVARNQFDGVVVNHVHATALNGMMLEMIMKLEDIELRLWKNGISPTLDHLRQAWREKREITDFVSFANQVIDHSDRRKNTKQNLRQTVRKVEQFRPVSLSEMDYLYLKDFEDWLRSHHSMMANTIHKEMRNIRTLLGEAMKGGLLKENPFLRYTLPRTVRAEHIVLTDSELKNFMKCTLHPEVRDAFLFCCFTGLRFSDYKMLSEDNFRMIQGKQWLVYITVKTGVEVRIPIFAIGNLPHPAITSNAVVNRQLHQICKEARIQKAVTFHTSRHTFATLMLSRGIPITSVQRMLGHTSVRMTEKYAETTYRKVAEDVVKAFHQ